MLSDRGMIVPSRLWRIGRSSDAKIFQRELKADAADFVVDVLIDASGSQMSRQGEVAIQAYIISETLSNVEIPHRVMSFCTFWIIRSCTDSESMTIPEQKMRIFLIM